MAQYYGKVWSVFRKLNTELSEDSAILLLGIYPKELRNRFSNTNLYIKVHSSSIHNNENVETTQMPINR